MAKPFAEYITVLCKLSGIKEDDPKLTELKEKLGEFEFTEDQQSLLDSKVMHVETAKQNSEVYDHMKAKILDGIDKDHANIMKEEGFSDEEITQLKSAKTPERVKALYAKIKAKHKAALDDLPKGTNKEEINALKEDYQKQLDELGSLVGEKDKELSQTKLAHENELIDYKFQNVLSTRSYSDKYEKEHALLIAKEVVRKAMEKDNIQLVRGDNEIMLKTSEGFDYMVGNEKPTLSSYTDNVLAENKLLASATKPTFTQPFIPNGSDNDQAAQIHAQMQTEI